MSLEFSVEDLDVAARLLRGTVIGEDGCFCCWVDRCGQIVYHAVEEKKTDYTALWRTVINIDFIRHQY